MIKEYLIHSYLYYKLNEIIIEDTEYDQLCKDLLSSWDKTDSPYKDLINPSDLLAGTGYSIEEYPDEIVSEAKALLAKHRKKAKYVEYRTVTDDPEELYKALKDSSDWFLKALRVDYNMSFRKFPEKREMTVGVVDRILKERSDGV